MKFCLDFGDDFKQGNGSVETEIMGKRLKSCQIHDQGQLGLAKTNTFQVIKGGARDITTRLEFHFAERVEHRVLKPTPSQNKSPPTKG